jgi:hypothetical protein
MFEDYAYEFHEGLHQKHGKVARIYGMLGVGNDLYKVSRSVVIMGPYLRRIYNS